MKMSSENHFRLIEGLKSPGLTKYEALVSIGILKVISATATEIHGSSGVPRASFYPVIGQLLDKDLVSVFRRSRNVLRPYRRKKPSPGCGRISTATRIMLPRTSSAIHTGRMRAGQGSEELIWNIHGRESMQKKLVDLISGAKKDIRFFARTRIFSDDIRQALTAAPDTVDCRGYHVPMGRAITGKHEDPYQKTS